MDTPDGTPRACGSTATTPRSWKLRLATGLLATGILATPSTTLATPPPAPPPAPTGSVVRVPVLMYHRISCPPRRAALPSLWVCPKRFRQQLRALRDAGWRTITARDLMASIRAGATISARTFVIVIDDGDRDGFDHGRPILTDLGFVATYAVVVSRIGKRVGMTWEELNQMVAEGHEIASHTMDHDDVSAEGAAGREREILRSARILEKGLGIPTRTFVYPYGAWDAEAVEDIRAAGYRSAFTTAGGCTVSWSDRFVEERVRVNGSDSPATVLSKAAAC